MADVPQKLTDNTPISFVLDVIFDTSESEFAELNQTEITDANLCTLMNSR